MSRLNNPSPAGPGTLTIAAHEMRLVYDLCAEFGPQRRIPLAQRIYERLPHLNEGQVAAAIDRAHAIEAAAWELAESVWDNRLGEGQARGRLARLFPELDRDRLSRAMGQALVFVRK